MDLETYARDGKPAYEEFARTVGRILETVTRGSTQFRVQQIQTRAKDVASLRTKLEIRNQADSAAIEAEIKDLAGCRIIFYSKADVRAFISSDLIHDNFLVDWDRTKFHYPSPDPGADELFISYNYVVSLRPDRLALPEYSAFAGMMCEVQVQTTLDHAWSEMAHDTIYKRPAGGFGTRLMATVERRMADVMRTYLQPAGFEFQKIAVDVRRLERGRTLIAQDPLRRIVEAPDNNLRYELLREFTNYVLPHYDSHIAVAPAIRAAMVDAIHRARETPSTPMRPGDSSWAGVPSDWVASKALEVIDAIGRVSLEAVDDTFDALRELAPGASTEERRRLLASVETLARHRRGGGFEPVVQQRLLARTATLPADARKPVRDLVLRILELALSLEVSDAAATALDVITFYQGAVAPSAALQGLRRSAVQQLRALFAASQDDDERRRIVEILLGSGRIPGPGALTAELVEEAYDSAREAVAFATEVCEVLSYETRQAIEHDVLWIHRRAAYLPPTLSEVAALEAKRLDLRAAAMSFRERANADPEFVIHKTLVGFETVLDPWWDGASDIKAEHAYRAEAVERLAQGVDLQDLAAWRDRIRRAAATQSADGATFPSFRAFLEAVAHRLPSFGLELLGETALADFLAAVLLGLEGTEAEAAAQEQASGWRDGARRIQVAAYCQSARNLHLNVLDACLSAALADDDHVTAIKVMEVCARRHDEAPQPLMQCFVSALDGLASAVEPQWVNGVWFLTRDGGLIAELAEADVDRALRDLVRIRRLDTHAEWVVAGLTRRWPEKLLAYLGERLALASSAARPADFEPVPFDVERLKVVLEGRAGELISAARRWFDDDPDLFELRAGALPARFFPGFADIEASLLERIDGAERRDLEFVLRVLRGYEGQRAIHPICQAVIDRLEENDELLGLAGVALDESGTLSGEYGLVERDRARRQEMEAWLADPRRRVAAFARRRMSELDRSIAAEQRRAEESYELRKRDFES